MDIFFSFSLQNSMDMTRIGCFVEKMAIKQPSITQLIKKYLLDNGHKQRYLSDLLKITPQNLTKKLSKNELDSGFIRDVSTALGHDFFLELSRQLRLVDHKNELSKRTGNDMVVSKDEYIAVLKENTQLSRELRDKEKELERVKSASKPVRIT